MTIGTKITREALFRTWGEHGMQEDVYATIKDRTERLLAMFPEQSYPAGGLSPEEAEEWKLERSRRIQIASLALSVFLAEFGVCLDCKGPVPHPHDVDGALKITGEMICSFVGSAIQCLMEEGEEHRRGAVSVITIPLRGRGRGALEDAIGEALYEALRAADEQGPVSPRRSPSTEAKDGAPGGTDGAPETGGGGGTDGAAAATQQDPGLPPGVVATDTSEQAFQKGVEAARQSQPTNGEGFTTP